jgi:hypothetical protein
MDSHVDAHLGMTEFTVTLFGHKKAPLSEAKGAF